MAADELTPIQKISSSFNYCDPNRVLEMLERVGIGINADATSYSDPHRVIETLEQYPDYLHYSDASLPSWLHRAAAYGMLNVCRYLLDRGLDINFGPEVLRSTPLESTMDSYEIITKNKLVMIRFLLSNGADPNISRPIISAINPRRGTEDESLELVQILVEEGGADVNRVYDIYGNPANTFTALEFAQSHGRTKIVEYLKSKGAVER